MSIDLAIVAGVAPIVIGLVAIAKEAGLPSRWAGVAAALLGIVLGLVAGLAPVGDATIVVAGLSGLVGGLTAAGVYSGQKAARGPA